MHSGMSDFVNMPYVNDFVNKAIDGKGDSDRHLLTLFSIALASKGKVYVELGVREGHTTQPLYHAAVHNLGKLYSVDINEPTEYQPYVNGFKDSQHYMFCRNDSITSTTEISRRGGSHTDKLSDV